MVNKIERSHAHDHVNCFQFRTIPCPSLLLACAHGLLLRGGHRDPLRTLYTSCLRNQWRPSDSRLACAAGSEQARRGARCRSRKALERKRATRSARDQHPPCSAENKARGCFGRRVRITASPSRHRSAPRRSVSFFGFSIMVVLARPSGNTAAKMREMRH